MPHSLVHYIQINEGAQCLSVECLTVDRGFAGSILIGVTALCLRARHINPCLVLVQRMQNRPDITEFVKNQIKQNKK